MSEMCPFCGSRDIRKSAWTNEVERITESRCGRCGELLSRARYERDADGVFRPEAVAEPAKEVAE